MANTLFDALVAKNPRLNPRYLKKSSNTKSDDWTIVRNWREWRDFNYKNLLSLYETVLLRDGGREIPELHIGGSYDEEIWDERTLEQYLAKYMLPTVNWAFNTATKSFFPDMNEPLYIAPGSWTGREDWSLVSHHRMAHGLYHNLLPGETKLSSKWRPDMKLSDQKSDRENWTYPVSQIQFYAKEHGRRYGYIITDEHLVVLRFTTEPIGAGSAKGRPQRQNQAPVHQRFPSASTASSGGAMETQSTSSFAPRSNEKEIMPPEYAVIPWSAQGKGRLTVKLALFCLSMMAASGNGHMDDSYPPFDTWRKTDRGYEHNTSGRYSANRPPGAEIVQPEGQARDIVMTNA